MGGGAAGGVGGAAGGERLGGDSVPVCGAQHGTSAAVKLRRLTPQLRRRAVDGGEDAARTG